MLHRNTGEPRDELYYRSMGKIFLIRAIVAADQEANEYTARNHDTGVIGTMSDGAIIIADLYGITLQSRPSI
jgi:hypothetical protein